MAATALPRSEPSADRAALARFLAEASGASRVDITGFERLAGGAIQENWGFDALFSGGRYAGTQQLVLRTDAPTGLESSLGRIEEFAVLRAVFAAGVKAPEPLFACADPAVFRKPFFVMRRVAGTAQGRRITTDSALEPVLPALASRLGQELARIQSIRPPRADLAFLPAIDAAQHIAGFRTYLDTHPNPRPVLEWAIDWLASHRPEPVAPVLCHRDFRTGNYMLYGSELTGILDWEFAGWGDPDEDIGWFCCKGWRFARLDREAGGIAARASFYEGYESAAGRRLDPERVRFWEVLANVRWAVIALQQGDRNLIGGARDLGTAIIGRRASECELELLMMLDPGGSPSDGPSKSRPALPDSLRDRPSGIGLVALGRELLLDELLPLLPPERHRELRLVATAMAMAEREAIAGEAPAEEIGVCLRRFYAEAPTPTLPLPPPQAGEGRVGVERGRAGAVHRWSSPAETGEGWAAELNALLHRFAADLRVGSFASCDARARAARAVLWRLTILKLREGNPSFLAENGFGE